MPDLQVLTFTKNQQAPQGTTVASIPSMRGDLNMPLNDDGTFGPGKWQTNPNTGVRVFNESPLIVSDVDKAIQDTVKGLLTVRGSDYLAPSYGTVLSSLVNTRKIGDVATQITAEVQYLLGYLAQANSGTPDTEIVSDIVSLNGKQDRQTINLELTVQTLGGSQGSILLT